MLKQLLYLCFILNALSAFSYKEDSTLSQLKIIEGKINPKSIVHSGNGLFFAQNMMYKHTVTVYNRNFQLLKTISDKVELNKYGYSRRKGLYRGSPVECTFTHNGRYAWISNYNMSGGSETEFSKPGCDNCHGTGIYDSSFVYKINTSTLLIEAIVKVGAVPKYFAATPDNKYVLVTNWSSSDLSVIDTEKLKEIKRIKLGTYPRGIEVDSAGTKAYVTIMGSSKIAVIDLRTFEKTWIKDVGRSPRHLCMSPKNDYLYVSLNGDGVVGKIDLSTNEMKKVKTGSLPRSMALSGDGRHLYVVNYGSDTLTKVTTLDMKVVDNIKTNDKPIGITYDDETNNIWVACYEGSIMVFHDSYYDSTVTDSLYYELLAQNAQEIDFRKKLPLKDKGPMLESEIEKPVDILPDKIIGNKVNEYYLIAGSFKNKLNAEKLVKELSVKGHNSFIYFNLDNQFTYACVGSCASKSIAIEKSNALKEGGISVWLYSVR